MRRFLSAFALTFIWSASANASIVSVTGHAEATGIITTITTGVGGLFGDADLSGQAYTLRFDFNSSVAVLDGSFLYGGSRTVFPTDNLPPLGTITLTIGSSGSVSFAADAAGYLQFSHDSQFSLVNFYGSTQGGTANYSADAQFTFAPDVVPISVLTPFSMAAVTGSATFAWFTFHNGTDLIISGSGAPSFVDIDLSLTVVQTGVPEISTWAMMLFGFAGIFLTSRRFRPHHTSLSFP